VAVSTLRAWLAANPELRALAAQVRSDRLSGSVEGVLRESLLAVKRDGSPITRSVFAPQNFSSGTTCPRPRVPIPATSK
jgi:hypothetical protein